MADLGVLTTIQGTSNEQVQEMTDVIETPLIAIHKDDVQVEQDPPPYSEKEDMILDESNNDSQGNEDIVTEGDDLLIGDTLSPLEKLIKFSNSSLVLQRIVITRDISSTIQSISLEEAVHTALPIIIQLGKDPEDSVREALASELDKIIYYYYANAPPQLLEEDTQQLHIPKHAFVVTMIEFLLDQNTTLASIAQQSIVTIASELAETPRDSPNYQLHQALLDQEIFQGVLWGLMDIFNEKQQDNDEIIDSYHKDNTDTGDIEEKIPIAEENTKLKNYDHGSINLAKMVCLMLISALAPVFGPEGCKEKILPIVESMVTDPMFYVRKEAATAVGSLSTVLMPDITLDRLLPLYRKLSVDTIWHVRRSCVFSLPLLVEVLPADMKSTITIEGVELFKNDVSRNVRNSLADIVGELISKFLPDEPGKPGVVPDPLLEFFLSLGNTTGNPMFKLDIERIHNCAYNFPAVVLTAGVTYWDTCLKETYLNITKDYQLKVRRTFAYSLHEIARIIGPERTERDLVQIFALYLMDLDDVKEGVLEHLSEFLSVLAVSSRNDYIPILAEVWDGVMSNWHLRDILTRQLRDIVRLFDAARVVEHILPLALRACHDEFAAVRESGVEIFPVILDIVKRTVDEGGENLSQVELEGESDDVLDPVERQQKFALALLNHVMEKLDELAKSSTYRTRLVFTQICRSLLEAGIHPADFASFFLPRLVLLAKDPIVNIRIATSRTMHLLCSIHGYKEELESLEDMNQALDEIFYHLSTDPDQDVHYFVHKFVSQETQEMYQARRDVEELEIAKQTLLKVHMEETLPPPPPPAHLVTAEIKDEDENMESPKELPAVSPMDIHEESRMIG